MIDSPPRSCLVLGGTGHIGSEVCKLLSQEGVRVAFTFLSNESKARKMEASLPASEAIRADLRQYSEAAKVVEYIANRWGGIDALVQCAGTGGDPLLYREAERDSCDKFLDITEEGFREMMDLTVKSTFAACQAASRAMRAAKGGNIVIVGSMDGVKSVPAPIHYAASKGALVSMTWALAKELGRYGILVNLVAPGILDGGIARLLSDELRNEYLKHCALGRVGKPQEVANIVAWLVMKNTYVTGQSMLLDGGL